MTSIFFSYSHRDETLRNELGTHLSSLKRQGMIETWHDRRVEAGQEILNEINDHLEKADIILLLVSPYFIASDYCYNIEMARALERHEKEEARVIPVILEPCDWQDAPFGMLLATPTDGKPISKFPNLHDAFLEVTMAIKEIAKNIQSNHTLTINQLSSSSPKNSAVTNYPRSSNLRVKKAFTDKERDKFLTDSFEYIANFFEGSLMELEKRNRQIDMDFRRIDADQFTSAIYNNGSLVSKCRIWVGGQNTLLGGISYSRGQSGNSNSLNESLSVVDDGFLLFLKPLGMMMYNRQNQDKLSQQGGAEFLWDIFIQPLRR